MEKSGRFTLWDEPEVPILVPDQSSNRSGHFNRVFPLRRFLKVVEMSDEKKPIWPTFKRSDGEYQKLTRYLTSYPNP